MTQEFLYDPDVVVCLQQMRRKRMAEGVNIDLLGYASQTSSLNSLLETAFMDVMSSNFTRPCSNHYFALNVFFGTFVKNPLFCQN